MTDILICSYLETDLVDRIRAASNDVRVHYEPELLPKPRYAADHIGEPFQRTESQRRAWRELLGRAEVCFDVDHTDLEGFASHASRVRWIQASSAGIGQFVVRHGLDRLGATFTTAAGVHAVPLAEFVAWSMLAFAKDYPRARAQQREHVWRRFHTSDLAGSTLAVIGLGSIGRQVAATARALGVRVIGSKRTVDGIDPGTLNVDALFATRDLKAMLAQADYVCLVAPHTAETEGMIGTNEFAVMKPGAVLINIGRGALVQEVPLLAALRGQRLRGAVLDVAPSEPLPSEHPLWDMDNVILFPHSASTSSRENERLTELFIDNLGRYLSGRPLRNVFDAVRQY